MTTKVENGNTPERVSKRPDTKRNLEKIINSKSALDLLYEGIVKNNTDTVRSALSLGAESSKCIFSNGDDATLVAAMKNELEILKLFLEKDDMQKTSIGYLFVWAGGLETLKYLNERMKDEYPEDKYKSYLKTALSMTTSRRERKYLLEQGARGRIGKLYSRIRYGPVIELDEETQKKMDKQLLEAAKKGGEFKKVKQLLKEGANVNIRDENDKTPLIWAALNDDIRTAKLLLKREEIYVNAEDNEGNTAMSIAWETSKKRMPALLWRNGGALKLIVRGLPYDI
jgi:ankyrin repeat protein